MPENWVLLTDEEAEAESCSVPPTEHETIYQRFILDLLGWWNRKDPQ